MKKIILVVDDNEDIVDILSSYLLKDGFKPVPAYNGEDALIKFNQLNPALVLLDIMLPKVDGLQVCSEIRKVSNTPIIMITAKSEDSDIITGLDVGADDYVIKPYSPGAVMARVRAVLRRIDVPFDQVKNTLYFNGLEIEIGNYEIRLEGKLVNLTKKEIEILWMLAVNKNKVFTRDELMDFIWGQDYIGDPRCVDTHIKRIRAKLNLQKHYDWEIKTIWSVGYKFEVQNSEK